MDFYTERLMGGIGLGQLYRVLTIQKRGVYINHNERGLVTNQSTTHLIAVPKFCGFVPCFFYKVRDMIDRNGGQTMHRD